MADGFATHAEIDSLRIHTPNPRGGGSQIGSWRWDVPDSPPTFRTLVVRAQAVLREHFGVSSLRFYRSNIITWEGRDPDKQERETWPAQPARWAARSLHGDTNTDEMFLYTAILYLSQHGEDVMGAETGIADEVDGDFTVGAGLRVEPSIGRLLVFSAGVENMHEMLPATHGQRVAIQFWFACEGMDPGWAHDQRLAWAAEHGWGGPSSETRPAVFSPPLSAGLQQAAPWHWRH